MATQKETEKLLRDVMGETVHTAFRKGADGPAASRAWRAIKAMPDSEWSKAVDWMVWAMAYSIKGDIIVKPRKRAAEGR